jgi:hypothetical protein
VIVKRRMTPAEARAFVARWQLANAAEIEELRATPPDVKLQQLAALMASAGLMGWRTDLAAEDAEVRERWAKLRKAYGV